jgi:D-lactate dehydrogenase
MTDLRLFSARRYDTASFEATRIALLADGPVPDFDAVESRLDVTTAALAAGIPAVCAFVNDDLSSAVIDRLADGGTSCVALRCAGYNHVDLDAAARRGLTVVRVPAYSPHAVAEHTLALILALNRHIHRAHDRVRNANFSLDGLVGFDLAGSTAGVVGTGRIGALVASTLAQLGCRVLAHDPVVDAGLVERGVRYVDLPELFADSRVIVLTCPLTPATHHLVDADAIATMRNDVLLVNTGRGALVDTRALIDALKQRRIGAVGLDVYEEEAPLFFEDRSDQILTDDVFARLLTFPNVLVTAHQAFLTHEALAAIAETTLRNVADVLAGRPCANAI